MSVPYDQVLVLDFETAWDRREYTLSKLTTEQYIRDPRFRAWGASYKFLGDSAKPRWVTGDDLPTFFDTIDWSRTAVLAHNAQFDVSILSWVYGHQPCFIFDSLSMARATRGLEAGNSLATLAAEFGLPPKGNAVHSTDGVLDVLTDEVERELAEYCCHDTYLCEEVFTRLIVGYPVSELKLIDMSLRMYINPVLTLDQHLLTEAIIDERDRREGLLKRLAVSEDDLASNPKFAEVLRALGVEPPMKVSKTTGAPALALAKNDALFQALLNSDNEDVALLCEARLAVKSTLERTRAQRFLDIARRGTLPVPLNYWGAHTGRFQASRGSGINMQNLKRGSFLRRAIQAPSGSMLVVADLSQIEPRVLAWLADYQSLLDIFASGADPYAAFGSQMFGIPGMTKESHPDLRQSAKSALLGAGYGLGWWSFAAQLLVGFLGAPPQRYDAKFAKSLGVTKDEFVAFSESEWLADKALTIPRTCTDEEIVVHGVASKKIIDTYRRAALPVVGLWSFFDEVIYRSLYSGTEASHKCLSFKKGEIQLPSGMALRYPHLKRNTDDKGRVQWTYGDQSKKLYGSKLVENVVQAVARCVMTDGMLRIQKRYPCVMTVHDEVVVLVPEAEAEEAEGWVHEQMVKAPKYMPGIPLAADTGTGVRYGDAK